MIPNNETTVKTMSEKLYAQRDTESLGELIFAHASAMTTEGLHGKYEIAGELAWRDAEIRRLREIVGKLLKTGDGAEIVPDMNLFYREPSGNIRQIRTCHGVMARFMRDLVWHDPENCFSTRAAALASQPPAVNP